MILDLETYTIHLLIPTNTISEIIQYIIKTQTKDIFLMRISESYLRRWEVNSEYFPVYRLLL